MWQKCELQYKHFFFIALKKCLTAYENYISPGNGRKLQLFYMHNARAKERKFPTRSKENQVAGKRQYPEMVSVEPHLVNGLCTEYQYRDDKEEHISVQGSSDLW